MSVVVVCSKVSLLPFEELKSAIPCSSLSIICCHSSGCVFWHFRIWELDVSVMTSPGLFPPRGCPCWRDPHGKPSCPFAGSGSYVWSWPLLLESATVLSSGGDPDGSLSGSIPKCSCSLSDAKLSSLESQKSCLQKQFRRLENLQLYDVADYR